MWIYVKKLIFWDLRFLRLLLMIGYCLGSMTTVDCEGTWDHLIIDVRFFSLIKLLKIDGDFKCWCEMVMHHTKRKQKVYRYLQGFFPLFFWTYLWGVWWEIKTQSSRLVLRWLGLVRLLEETFIWMDYLGTCGLWIVTTRWPPTIVITRVRFRINGIING